MSLCKKDEQDMNTHVHAKQKTEAGKTRGKKDNECKERVGIKGVIAMYKKAKNVYRPT